MIARRWKQVLISLVLLVAGLAVFVWLVWQEGPQRIVENLVTFGFLPFIGFLFISMLNFTLYSLRWKIILNEHLPAKKRFSLGRMYFHRMAGFAVSYLTPVAQVGGEPARILMLTTDGVPAKKATSSVLLDIAFELTAYLLFIGAGVLLAILYGLGDGGSFLLIGFGLAVLLVVLVLFFYMLAYAKRGLFTMLCVGLGLDKKKGFKGFCKSTQDTEELMRTFIRGRGWLLAKVSFLSFAVISFRVVEVFYIAYFLGVLVNLPQAFLVSTLPGVALLLPVPGGVGVFEGSFAAIFVLLAIPINVIAFAVIIRARDLIFILIGVLHIANHGRGFTKKALNPDLSQIK